MAGAVIGKGGHNIQKLRTEVSIDKISIAFERNFFVLLSFRNRTLFPLPSPLSRVLEQIPFFQQNVEKQKKKCLF